MNLLHHLQVHRIYGGNIVGMLTLYPFPANPEYLDMLEAIIYKSGQEPRSAKENIPLVVKTCTHTIMCVSLGLLVNQTSDYTMFAKVPLERVFRRILNI